MRSRIFKQILNPWAAGFSFLIWTCLGALLCAEDVPMGQPYDLTSSNSCADECCCASPPRCPWYVQVDALFLKRDRVDRVPIAALTVPENIVFSTSDLDSPFRASPRLLVGHTFGDSRWQIDGTYFFIDSWDASAETRDSSGNLFSPFSNFGQPTADPNFDHNTLVSVREFSQLRNGELNLRYTLPMPHEYLTPKLIIGLRYMSIDEQFDYTWQSVVHPAPGASISTRTTNDLFGPQIGGEFYFFAYPQCWIDLGIKGALCNNRAVRTGNVSRDATAFVGDLDLSLVWQIAPRLTTRMGYQAIWVNDIAMAARNFELPASEIDTIGRAVYHGPHIGLECTW